MSQIPFETLPTLPDVLLDRTTLQNYALCPFMGWSIETGKVFSGSPEADSGQEVHRVIAEAIDLYAADGIPPREYLEAEIVKVRPDIQQDALAGLRPSIWAIDRFVTGRNPQDFIAFQGGQGEHSGQLAWELLPATDKRGAIMPTSEVDLLLAGETKTELELVDWKSGRRPWTSTDVKTAFQFRMFAWLCFRNYPELELLHAKVFMTRMNMQTPRVTFTRKHAEDFEGVLLQAVEYRRQALASEQPESWPACDKCLLCPATAICPRVIEPAFTLNTDPLGFASDTSVMELELSKRKEHLRKYVDEHGDITDGRVAFGLRAPKKVQKPRANQYTFYNPPDPKNVAPEVLLINGPSYTDTKTKGGSY